VVIRVDRLLGAKFSTQHFDGTVRNDLYIARCLEECTKTSSRIYFVNIHIGLCPTASLENHKREVVHKFAIDNFSGSIGNSLANLRIKPVGYINMCSGFLKDTKCFDERGRKAFGWATNIKVLKGSVRSNQ
jgi:hypothetical protein